MNDPPIIVNSAHEAGLTRLRFSKDGQKFYTAGEDSMIRVWDATQGAAQEPKLVEDADEAITTLDCSHDGWIAAGQDSSVRRYDAKTDVFEEMVTRSTAVTVRCVSYNPSGSKVAVVSDELIVKIVDVKNVLDVALLDGHTKGVRAATWHPTGLFLTTSGQDGTIIVWDVSSGASPNPAHVIDGIIPAVDSESAEFAYDPSAIWHPNGKYFVAASRTHDIVSVSRDSWSKSGTFSKDGGHGCAVSALSFSPNGHYLVSAGADGRILIWESSMRNILFRYEDGPKVPITSVYFAPTQNHIAWTDLEGSLTRWEKPIPTTHPSPYKTLTPAAKTTSSKPNYDDLFDLDKDASKDMDAEDEYKDDWIIDDDDGYTEAKEIKDVGDNTGLREMVNVTKAQPAFQTGSTPFKNKKRYLAFNMIGVIDSTDQDTHHIVNVEFYDRSLRRGYHFQDHFKFDKASLGPRGALYACSAEGKNTAQINYRPYDSWASSSEWQIGLPVGEEVVAMCAGGAPYKKGSASDDDDDDGIGGGPLDSGGSGYVIVATNSGCVRFWLGTGVQTYVWHLGGEVVAMEAGAEWVFIIHRDGGTSLDGCQNLRYTLMALQSFDIINSGPVPLAKGVTLKWMGITSEGAPAIYDSHGMLSILDRFRRPTQGRWVPALDTNTLARREGKDESYWAVGLSSNEFKCLILKGRETHPSFPPPLIQEIEVQMPMLNIESPQVQSEEKILREKIALGMKRDALNSTEPTPREISQLELVVDKALIALIQTACKADKLERALDYTNMLHHLASFDTAKKVAAFYHLPGLQEKMGVLKELREDDPEEDFDPRKGWGKVSEPVGRAGVASLEHSHHSNGNSNGRNFEAFPPPPIVPRRGLAAASPLPSRAAMPPIPSSFSSVAALPEDVSLSEEPESYMEASGSGAKRKRDDDGDVVMSSAADNTTAWPSPKRRPPPAPVVAPSKSANPFARKKPRDTAPSASPNPFARSGVQKSLSTVKSNSFFEKVDAAEDKSLKGKKGKRDVRPRQTTLFGLPPPPAAEKPSRKGKEKAPGNGNGIRATSTSNSAEPEEEATQLDEPSEEGETQMTEGGDGEAPEEDDQGLEETQRDESPEWEVPDDGQEESAEL